MAHNSGGAPRAQPSWSGYSYTIRIISQIRITPLMGCTGGDSGNEVGFVLLSLAPGPNCLFLVLSAIVPQSDLPTLLSSAAFCKFKDLCWFKCQQSTELDIFCPILYLLSISSCHTHRLTQMAPILKTRYENFTSVSDYTELDIEASLSFQMWNFQTKEHIFTSFYST